MKTIALHPNEFNSYNALYINQIPENISLREGFKLGKEEKISFFEAINDTDYDSRYSEGKWTIKEVFQHIIDTERIFINRTFRIARNDKAALTGYDQDIYIAPSKANNKTKEDLLAEYKATRDYSISIINSLTDDDLKIIGIANDDTISARAAAFVILGHEIWHMNVIKNKYLNIN